MRNRGKICYIKRIHVDSSIVDFFIERTITNRIWGIIARTQEEEHQEDANKEH